MCTFSDSPISSLTSIPLGSKTLNSLHGLMILVNIHLLITAITDPLERIKRTKHNVKPLIPFMA